MQELELICIQLEERKENTVPQKHQRKKSRLEVGSLDWKSRIEVARRLQNLDFLKGMVATRGFFIHLECVENVRLIKCFKLLLVILFAYLSTLYF